MVVRLWSPILPSIRTKHPLISSDRLPTKRFQKVNTVRELGWLNQKPNKYLQVVVPPSPPDARWGTLLVVQLEGQVRRKFSDFGESNRGQLTQWLRSIT